MKEEEKKTAFTVSEGMGVLCFCVPPQPHPAAAQDRNEWELSWVNVDQVWPGGDNVSLLVLFKGLFF